MSDRRLRWLYSSALSLAAFALVPAVPLASAQLLAPIASAVIAACVLGLAEHRSRSWTVAAASAVVAAVGCASLWLATGASATSWPTAAAAVLASAVVGALAAAGARRVGERRAALAVLGVVLFVGLWLSGVTPLSRTEPAVIARATPLLHAPAPETYSFDGALYLRTYDLMRHGEAYYPAFRQAVNDDKRHDASFLTSPLNYREPLVFELWQLLPGSNGVALLGWFALWSLGTVAAAYWLSSSIAPPPLALLAPISLMRFFAFFWWADRAWFTITEVWAAGLAVAAVAALLRGNRRASLVLLVLAVASRELLIVLVVAWLADWWWREPALRGRTVWFPVAAVLGPLAAVGAHFLSVPPLAPGGGGASGWLHGGPQRLVDALMFGWSPIAHQSSWLALLIAALAVVAAVRARPDVRRAVLLAVVVASLGFLLAFSGGPSWLYWGACFTPLLAAIAPAALCMAPCADTDRAPTDAALNPRADSPDTSPRRARDACASPVGSACTTRRDGRASLLSGRMRCERGLTDSLGRGTVVCGSSRSGLVNSGPVAHRC